MSDEDLMVVGMMERYGGSFGKALAQCALKADSENLAKIKATWPDLWRKYAEFAGLK